MTSSPAPDAIALSGADCFLRAFDAEVGRTAGASHLAQIVLRLGPGLDVERLEAMLREAALAQPILRAPIRRPWHVLPPVFRTDLATRAPLPRIEVHDECGPRDAFASPPRLFQDRLNERHDGARGELLRCDVLRYDGGDSGYDVAFTWLHMLLDGSGSERFLRWLDEVARGVRPASVLPDDGRAAAETPLLAGMQARGDQALKWQGRMRSIGKRGPHSLSGPLVRMRQELRYDVTTFSADETAQIVARAKKSAGFLTPMLFYLAAGIRAHRAVHRARGTDPGSFVVPLPVNLRAKGGHGEIFGTRVSLVWFQVFPDQVESFEGLLTELKAQRLAAIKEGLVEAGAVAMDFARWMPGSLYARMARRTFGGELCSFFFGYTDEFLSGLTHFFGAPIVNGFHAPSVPPSPGSATIFSIHAGRLNLSHIRQAGVFSDAERVVFQAALRADLLGS